MTRSNSEKGLLRVGLLVMIFASATQFYIYLPWVNTQLAYCPTCKTSNFKRFASSSSCLSLNLLFSHNCVTACSSAACRSWPGTGVRAACHRSSCTRCNIGPIHRPHTWCSPPLHTDPQDLDLASGRLLDALAPDEVDLLWAPLWEAGSQLALVAPPSALPRKAPDRPFRTML